MEQWNARTEQRTSSIGYFDGNAVKTQWTSEKRKANRVRLAVCAFHGP